MKKVFYVFLSILLPVGGFAQNGQTDFRRYGNTSWVASGINPEQMKNKPLRSDYRSETDVDYSQGIFIVNEDWYGHQNSSVNFLTNQGEWIYRVFQKENPGRELGCTTQFGTIYGDKFYLVSKQFKDPGAKIAGSRFAVCNAKTMKIIKEFEYIATKTVPDKQGQDSIVSIADGRSYLPVDEHKGYIGTSNGIWSYNSDNMTIGKQIKGTGNPNEEGYGQLYYAQIGAMIRTNDYVFALHQEDGLLVIDPETDQIVRTISAPVEKEMTNGKEKEVKRGFGSIVKSKDGNLWISMAKNTSGLGDALSYMLKLNPFTFEIDTIKIPTADGIEMIPNSWYAWTADAFCASTKENKIYWSGYGTGSWFTGFKIFSYDIDKKIFSLVIDLTKIPGNWRLYGTGFRIHPVTDELYCFLYHGFEDQNHELARISPSGELLQEYTMIRNYWFPALPVFTDNELPIVSSLFPATVKLTQSNPRYKLWLGDMATDADNMNASIVKTVADITPGSPFDAIIKNDSLIISINNTVTKDRRASVSVQFNSNGKLITREITVTSDEIVTANENIPGRPLSFYPNPTTDYIIVTGDSPIRAEIYSVNGTKVTEKQLTNSTSIDINYLPKGIYFVKIFSKNDQVVEKMIKK